MLRRFKSTLHRVVSTSGKPRLSCACFFDPDFDTVRFGMLRCEEPCASSLLLSPVINGE
jgi:isopenicillin N synthase-like dioxygenase